MKFSNLFESGSLIIIGLAVIVVIAIIVAVVMIKNKNKKDKEAEPSILDVQEPGVSENQEFSYGYEKEQTVVMQPVTENQEIPVEKTEESTTLDAEIPESKPEETTIPVVNDTVSQSEVIEPTTEVPVSNIAEGTSTQIPEVSEPAPEVQEPLTEVPVSNITEEAPSTQIPEVSKPVTETQEPLTEVPVSNIVEQNDIVSEVDDTNKDL